MYIANIFFSKAEHLYKINCVNIVKMIYNYTSQFHSDII